MKLLAVVSPMYIYHIPRESGTNIRSIHSVPSTNTYQVLVAAIEEYLNSKEREHVYFDATLVLEKKHNIN